MHYTASLRHLDQTEDQKKAALLLLNRSLCLLRLESPQAPQALHDCNQAVQYRPNDPKALYRRACAHQALGQLPEALRDAQASQELYTASNRAIPQDVSRLVARVQTTLASSHSDIAAQLQHAPLEGLGSAHSTATNRRSCAPQPAITAPAAAQLYLRHSPQEGRHLTTAGPISKGALLFSEDPVSAVLMKPHRKQRCHRCFRQLLEPYRVACRRCPQALYCSHACSAADPHHGSSQSPECGLPWPALLPEHALLASRLAHAAIQDAEVGQLISGLEHHFNRMNQEHRADLAVLACLLHACLLHHHRTLKPSQPSPNLQQTQSAITNEIFPSAPASHAAPGSARNCSLTHSQQPSGSSYSSDGMQSSTPLAAAVAAGSDLDSRQGQRSTMATATAPGSSTEGLQAQRSPTLHAYVPKLVANVKQDAASEITCRTAETVVSLQLQMQQQQQGAEAAASGGLRGGTASCHPSSWLCDGVPSAGFLLQILCQLEANGLAVVGSEHTGPQDRVALALYPTASMMNHACAPNLALQFAGRSLRARAIQDLPSGIALRHCYGPQVGECITVLRQQQLAKQYAFTCRCTACTDHNQLFREACQVGLQCPMPAPKAADASEAPISPQPADKTSVRVSGRSPQVKGCCGGPIVPRAELAPGVCSLQAGCQGGKAICFRCNKPLSICAEQDALQRLHQAARLDEQAACLLQPHLAADGGSARCGVGTASMPHQQPDSDIQEGCQLLQQCLKLRQQLLHPQNELLGRTWQRLAAAHSMLPGPDSQKQAIACCQKACEAIEYAYGRQSTAAAFQQAELAVLMASCSMDNAVTVAQAAKCTLDLHFAETNNSTIQRLLSVFGGKLC